MSLLKLAQIQRLKLNRKDKLIRNTVQNLANSGVVRTVYSSERRPWGRISTLCSQLEAQFQAEI